MLALSIRDDRSQAPLELCVLDLNKRILLIQYNLLNLPQNITYMKRSSLNLRFFLQTRYLLLIAIGILSVSNISAQTTLQEAERLDSLVAKLIQQERYSDAIELQKQRLDILSQINGEADTIYIDGLVFLGKYYARNRQLVDAIDILRKATDLYEKCINPSDATMALYLDNLAFYLNANHQPEEAEPICRKALGIYEKKGAQDTHLGAILMHLAEICYDNKQFQEALLYELRSLNIIKKINGEHSDLYIGELSYLIRYYEAVGDNEKIDRLKERIEILTKEKQNGYVDLPRPVQFKTPEICHQHNDDALICCTYYLTHRLSAPNMNEAAQYIMNWSVTSDDVMIEMGKTISQLFTKQEYLSYMVAYTAASAWYCLTYDMKQLDEEGYLKVMNALLNFYQQNKDLSGSVDVLENYLKIKKQEKRDSQILKEYREERGK